MKRLAETGNASVRRIWGMRVFQAIHLGTVAS